MDELTATQGIVALAAGGVAIVAFVFALVLGFKLRRMRGAHRAGRTVTLRLRFDDFGRATRSRSMLKATMQTRAIQDVARRLLAEARPLIETRGLTLVGVAVSNLDGEGNVQPSLFDEMADDRLDVAVDAVRDRFGSSLLTRAATLGRELGPSVPILPD